MLNTSRRDWDSLSDLHFVRASGKRYQPIRVAETPGFLYKGIQGKRLDTTKSFCLPAVSKLNTQDFLFWASAPNSSDMSKLGGLVNFSLQKSGIQVYV